MLDLIADKLPVSISLGLWSTLLAYLISIPLGIAKAVRHGSRFDSASSGVVIAAYAIPALIFAVLLRTLFSARAACFADLPARPAHIGRQFRRA